MCVFPHPGDLHRGSIAHLQRRTDTANKYGGTCTFIEPSDNIKVILFVAIFSAILTTPIAIFTHWLIKNVLAAPEITLETDESSKRASDSFKDKPQPLLKTHSTMRRLGIKKDSKLAANNVLREMDNMCKEIRKHREKLTDPDDLKEFDCKFPTLLILYIEFFTLIFIFMMFLQYCGDWTQMVVSIPDSAKIIPRTR